MAIFIPCLNFTHGILINLKSPYYVDTFYEVQRKWQQKLLEYKERKWKEKNSSNKHRRKKFLFFSSSVEQQQDGFEPITVYQPKNLMIFFPFFSELQIPYLALSYHDSLEKKIWKFSLKDSEMFLEALYLSKYWSKK